MEVSFDKTQVKKLAQEKIKLGLSKQQVFEELHKQFKLGTPIADIIQSLPSAAALKKYKAIHILFLILLSLQLLMLLLTLNLAGIVWTAPMIYFAATYKARYYGWALVAGIYGLLPALQLLLSPAQEVGIVGGLAGFLIFFISLTIPVLGFVLRTKLTPSYSEKKVLYKDSEGKSRFKLVLEFKD